MAKGIDKAKAEAKKRGVGEYARHVLICIGPDCCSKDEGEKAWERLKKRVGELNDRGGPQVYRSKVGCLRLCEQGPIAIVYPDGAWYAEVDRDAVDELVDCHLGEGKLLKEHLIAMNPLCLQREDD